MAGEIPPSTSGDRGSSEGYAPPRIPIGVAGACKQSLNIREFSYRDFSEVKNYALNILDHIQDDGAFPLRL